MTTYVLGAGASCDAGYPLAKTMGQRLLQWMKSPTHDPDSYAANYPAAAHFLEESFGPVENVEDLVTAVQNLIVGYENGTPEQRAKRALVGNQYGVFKNAVRAWFAEIQQEAAMTSLAYQGFARNIVAPGDCIITFNYDVSLDRELKLAGKFEAGDGYGFQIESLREGSSTKILKLHGSTSWLAVLFGGITSGKGGQFQLGKTLGARPAIPKNELSFLGYADAIDPAFASGGAAMPVMIFPARTKNFYFAANTGTEYTEFWDELWRQAAIALQSSDRVVICGYSLNSVDDRAHRLLLDAPKKGAEIIVGSGDDTDPIVKEYQKVGYTRAVRADEVLFKNWVAGFSKSAVAI
ncbi:MAG TPA: hypothetical protein VNW97_13770 [Candidatus Saccharimonadales bacterium]|nr:hypothetical protein [Candidatus Saccharimonadales bacterium]